MSLVRHCDSQVHVTLPHFILCAQLCFLMASPTFIQYLDCVQLANNHPNESYTVREHQKRWIEDHFPLLALADAFLVPGDISVAVGMRTPRVTGLVQGVVVGEVMLSVSDSD